MSVESETSTYAGTNGQAPTVVVTGANGLVGARVCSALAERGATVRALVRRPGTAPGGPGVEEVVGDFADAETAARVVAGAQAVVATVHPMGSDRETQHAVGVEGTTTLARAAADAGVDRFVHISTAAVYDRRPGVGDVAEDAVLVGDDGGDYPVTKRDAERSLAGIDGLTTILLRPPAIVGPGESSVWNSLRPAGIRDDESRRRVVPDQSWAWVYVDDLAVFAADLATGAVPTAEDPAAGPVRGAATPVNVSTSPATWRDYMDAVARGLGVEWTASDEPAWTGQVRGDRARAWGWQPRVDLGAALEELERDLSRG